MKTSKREHRKDYTEERSLSQATMDALKIGVDGLESWSSLVVYVGPWLATSFAQQRGENWIL